MFPRCSMDSARYTRKQEVTRQVSVHFLLSSFPSLLVLTACVSYYLIIFDSLLALVAESKNESCKPYRIASVQVHFLPPKPHKPL